LGKRIWTNSRRASGQSSIPSAQAALTVCPALWECPSSNCLRLIMSISSEASRQSCLTSSKVTGPFPQARRQTAPAAASARNAVHRSCQSSSVCATLQIGRNSPFVGDAAPASRGYYWDSALGMYYLQSRYYDPVVGRFINSDEFLSTGQGLLGFNMFAYTDNNPVNRIDPDGRRWYRIWTGRGHEWVWRGLGPARGPHPNSLGPHTQAVMFDPPGRPSNVPDTIRWIPPTQLQPRRVDPWQPPSAGRLPPCPEIEAAMNRDMDRIFIFAVPALIGAAGFPVLAAGAAFVGSLANNETPVVAMYRAGGYYAMGQLGRTVGASARNIPVVGPIAGPLVTFGGRWIYNDIINHTPLPRGRNDRW